MASPQKPHKTIPRWLEVVRVDLGGNSSHDIAWNVGYAWSGGRVFQGLPKYFSGQLSVSLCSHFFSEVDRWVRKSAGEASLCRACNLALAL